MAGFSVQFISSWRLVGDLSWMFVLDDISPDASGVMTYSGNKVEKVCELAHITLNKNAVFGDSSALAPGGVRIGMVPFPSVISSAVLRWSLFQLQFDCQE